jgi:hypothetical protein
VFQRRGTSLAVREPLESPQLSSLERFLDEQVTSNLELDVLLLFLAEPDRGWLPEAVAQRLVFSVEVCEDTLERLRVRGLLEAREGAGYWFVPANPELAAGAARLWSAYLASPVDVLRVLNERALERIRRGARRTFGRRSS